MHDEPTLRDRERYKRQLMLRGFTADHQRRLGTATALVAGIGGLGGTAALYLAAAGIGRLVLVHRGNLTLSNMNRQVLMRDDGIGTSRVRQAKKTLRQFNPDVAVEVHDERITAENADRLLRGAQVALSARPNFEERRALNRACVERIIPMVEAAMNGMEGYLFNVLPRAGSCLNCVYPADDPSWEELGFPVLGAVSGMLGCMMAIEAIKLLTGFGKPLLSEMLVFNTVDMEFKKVRTPRDERCEVCGEEKPAASGRISAQEPAVR
ncbi:MAG: HesA/MoeB/ThiF family protein [Nitrospiraceae bacterium]|nr:HesA/MoeB/ThiF family protein [Nitrospiraceae bacterium]